MKLSLITIYSAVALTAVTVSGCGTVGLVYTGVDAIASITTGKGVVDNVVSTVNKKDCKIHRFFRDEEVCVKYEE